MSAITKTRHQQRLELLSVFLREILHMDKELLEMVAEWSTSIGILLLIHTGSVSGAIGTLVVGVIMSVDLGKLVDAWREAKVQAEANQVEGDA